MADSVGLNENWLPIVGELSMRAQAPPVPLINGDVTLGWRLGYQNALSDLIDQLAPGAPGGRRLSADEIQAEDLRRERNA